MLNKPSKRVLYKLLEETIDDAELHIETSIGLLDDEDLEKAIIRCERAMAALGNAREEIERHREEISSQKMSLFTASLKKIQHSLWRATNAINNASREQFYYYKKAKNLRLHFLAHSYSPSKSVEESREAIKIS